MFDVNDLFEEVRSSIASTDNTDALWKEKLKFENGKDYIVRLLPYTKEGREGYSKTLYHYIKYSWQDQQGQWKNVISPRTWKAQCPISDYSKRVKYKGTPEEQEDAKNRLSYREGAYANVYVLKDPTNPENEGKVKILDMGKKLYNIIENALNGGLDEDWSEKARSFGGDPNVTIDVGRKVYDLSPNGINLVIRVRKNQFGLNSYETSSFTMANADLGKSSTEIDEILQACYDVSTLDPIMDFDAINKMFKETYFNCPSEVTETKPVSSKVAPINDEVPTFAPKVVEPAKVEDNVNTEGAVDDWFAKMNITSNG